MLIHRKLDRWEKLEKLGQMASDDIILPRANPAEPKTPYSNPRNNPGPAIYRSKLPNGKFTNLMQVMFTDFCKMDCHFCPNSHWVPRRRFAFKVDELARTFIELAERQTVDGLFLSSGVAGTGTKTTERMVKVVDLIRNKYNYKGYVHLKVMPESDNDVVEAAHALGSRLSVNLETVSADRMSALSKMKEFERDIIAPMAKIDQLNRSLMKGRVGQATQFVVGAADETDLEILQRVTQLYGEWDLRRVYYAPFRPVRHTPLEERPATPMARSNRLYQVDWLKRIYKYGNDEINSAFDKGGFLPLDMDPKISIALEQVDAFPVDINVATKDQLLRTPGLGPISVDRILKNRHRFKIDRWRDLQHMGVVRKRAAPFITFPGHKPQPAKQLRLDSLFHKERMDREDGGFSESLEQTYPTKHRKPATILADNVTTWSGEHESRTHTSRQPTPCGISSNCTGCSLYGAPGHPGSSSAAIRFTPSTNVISNAST